MFERFGVGRIAALGLASCRKTERFEKHDRKLLGGIDVEFAAGIAVNALFSGIKPRVKRRGKRGKSLAVKLEANLLHLCKHMRQRHFDII